MRLHGIKTLFAQQKRKSPERGKVTPTEREDNLCQTLNYASKE